jgi:hypothetical protein
MTDGVVSIAKRAVKALHSGELNPQTSYKLFARCALEQFPDSRNEAEATEKFRQTVHGQEWFNAERQQNYEDLQKSNALSAHVPLAKAWGNEASRQSEYETPPVTRADETPKVFERAVELLMKEKNISRDAAITEIYRAEKARKGLSF